jgi:type VI secretion system secreted protein VgrG
MNIEVHSTVVLAYYLALAFIAIFILLGIARIRGALKLKYYRKRRDMITSGWRLIFSSVILIGIAIFLSNYAEPVVYHFFKPSPIPTSTPTITLTPSITVTPSITLTPSITPTPAESYTPTITVTPQMPPSIELKFESVVTPDENAIFSPLQFATNIDLVTYQPIDTNTTFNNPIKHMYAVFSYDGMMPNSQWTALWLRNGSLIYYETKPWNGGTGGYGYTDWGPGGSEWVPGDYEVQIFNGTIWKVTGHFTVTGTPPTATKTPRPTATASQTPAPTLTRTTVPTKTPRPTSTASKTLAPTTTRTTIPTKTLRPSSTPLPTKAPTATKTLQAAGG